MLEPVDARLTQIGWANLHATFKVMSLFLQLSSDDYTPYAVQLASWGIAVVQYDFPALTIVADAVEVRRGAPCTAGRHIN